MLLFDFAAVLAHLYPAAVDLVGPRLSLGADSELLIVELKSNLCSTVSRFSSFFIIFGTVFIVFWLQEDPPEPFSPMKTKKITKKQRLPADFERTKSRI